MITPRLRSNSSAEFILVILVMMRLRSTFTMFGTRNEVYSEFVSEVLDEFNEGY